MASITIRNLDDSLKTALRVRAASRNRSMEEEVREILRAAVAARPATTNLAASIRSRFEPLGGVNLKLPKRGPLRPPPAFSK